MHRWLDYVSGGDGSKRVRLACSEDVVWQVGGGRQLGVRNRSPWHFVVFDLLTGFSLDLRRLPATSWSPAPTLRDVLAGSGNLPPGSRGAPRSFTSRPPPTGGQPANPRRPRSGIGRAFPGGCGHQRRRFRPPWRARQARRRRQGRHSTRRLLPVHRAGTLVHRRIIPVHRKR